MTGNHHFNTMGKMSTIIGFNFFGAPHDAFAVQNFRTSFYTIQTLMGCRDTALLFSFFFFKWRHFEMYIGCHTSSNAYSDRSSSV